MARKRISRSEYESILLCLLEKCMLDKILFEPVRNDYRHVIIIHELTYQITLLVILQEMAIAADKHVPLLGDNLCPPITLLLKAPDFHHRQFDPVLERPDIVLRILKHKNGHPSHAILAGGRSKLATQVKQVHNMAGVHRRRPHLPRRLCHCVKHPYPVVADI